jgi:glycosyltransferase involved in cell wall biosynthesis
MRIAITTDAWLPQVNGVVTTLQKTAEVLCSEGHTVLILTPEPFKTIPLPTYPSIRLAVRPKRGLEAMLTDFEPDAVHIATEGPLGLAARHYCFKNGLRFTTAYHTQFPQYVRLRAPVPLRLTYAYLRWFHAPAVRTMVATRSLRAELIRWHFQHVVIWSRGVDTKLFRPRDKSFINAPRPIFLCAGRVAVEKNLEAFLSLDLPGTKVIVGDGPDLERLRRTYPKARYLGMQHGEELAKSIEAADVFVFPSRTDTFGIVMLEAMACAVPVAAFPIPGPVDVVKSGVTGILDDDLRRAALAALRLDGRNARTYALQHTWQVSTGEFLRHLANNEKSAASAPQKSRSPAQWFFYRKTTRPGFRVSEEPGKAGNTCHGAGEQRSL